MSASHWIEISAATLSSVMGKERIGEPPLLLRPEPSWLAVDEQRQTDAFAQAELRQLGWVDQRDRVEGGVLDCLHLLGHPPIEYGAIFDAERLPRRVVVVGSGEVGVLARREGPVIRLAVLQDELLPESLIRQLSDVPPAATPAVNIRRADVSAADAFDCDGQALRQLARCRGQADPNANGDPAAPRRPPQ
jgi:hypothetical protein